MEDEVTPDPLNPGNPELPTDSTLPTFEDLDLLAAQGELTPETLNEKLNSYAAAYRQEYELSSAANPDNVEEYTRDFFKKNIHAAAAQIVWLSVNASSESVMMNASKYVIEAAIKDNEDSGDPIKDLLRRLKETPTPESATS